MEFRFSTSVVLFFLAVTTAGAVSDSASASGSGTGITENRPPSITGCTSNVTEDAETQQSINIIETILPTLNLSFTDPDGDNFTVASNISSLPSLTYVNVTSLNETASMVSFPGNELGTMVSRVVIVLVTTVTDSLGEQSMCTQTYRIGITVPAICSLIGRAPMIDRRQITLLLYSIELLVIDGNLRSMIMDQTIQSTIANILNDGCPNNCSLCEMTVDCQEFLPFCQQFGASNIEIVNSQPTAIGRKRQVTVISYIIAVVNPTLNRVFRNNGIFPPAALVQILDGNRALFTSGSGLTIVSISDNSITTTNNDASFDPFPLIMFFVAMLCLVISLAIGIAVVAQLGCAYKYRRKNKVTPLKPEICHVRPISTPDTEEESISTQSS